MRPTPTNEIEEIHAYGRSELRWGLFLGMLIGLAVGIPIGFAFAVYAIKG